MLERDVKQRRASRWDPEMALEMQELYAEITGLPEHLRMALIAVDMLGLSYREAGRALKVRETTITTRLFRARKQLAARLVPASAIGNGCATSRPHDTSVSG